MSRYQGPEGRIQVDYQYGLQEAVRDGVCRTPRISLIENDHVSITGPDSKIRKFSSLSDLFAEEGSAYSLLIQQEQAIRYMLASACARLAKIRHSNPAAAGLVIAASVGHAKRIAQLLQADGQQVTVVSYHHPDSAVAIQQFRSGTSGWIVSVGMISEGTDIPRLQVCCYLSPIKTELHYRQVLGRVLRRTAATNQEAWLYTFAEPKLVEYANRIAEDLPEVEVVVRDTPPCQKTPLVLLMSDTR
ncbi:DEAD/DEAH box helicase [Vogesella indigofera]|uniref:Helicase-related protein n=1 Tax=Vogesella indigofera TaxID=45465 RepID=A0ABT5I2Q1_VOGIN|nr:helicase-related protein [Vogesella indigofera]MDC7690374.1 helicase-related protein [Vogesella indigofera]